MSSTDMSNPWYRSDSPPPTTAVVPGSSTVDRAVIFLNRVGELLREKNRAYGDSAANPVRIFSRADSAEAIKVRIDDKLSRVARGSEFIETEDVIKDLVGYLALLAAVTETHDL